ncbi:hypothetical protein HK405_002598, partial [Cladochytrium tenue]
MFGDSWFFPISVANKRKYAERHGYDLIVLDDPFQDAPDPLAATTASDGTLPDPTPHAVWSKVVGLRRHIYDYDWIWLLDADAFVTNSAIKVEEFVASIESIHLTRPTDQPRTSSASSPETSKSHQHEKVPGPPPPAVLPYPAVYAGNRVGPDIITGMDCNGINAGSLLIRGARGATTPPAGPTKRPSGSGIKADTRPWPVRLVDFWLAMEPMPEYHGARGGLLEQKALAEIIDGNVLGARSHVATVPLRALNSYPATFTINCINGADP